MSLLWHDKPQGKTPFPTLLRSRQVNRKCCARPIHSTLEFVMTVLGKCMIVCVCVGVFIPSSRSHLLQLAVMCGQPKPLWPNKKLYILNCCSRAGAPTGAMIYRTNNRMLIDLFQPLMDSDLLQHHHTFLCFRAVKQSSIQTLSLARSCMSAGCSPICLI